MYEVYLYVYGLCIMYIQAYVTINMIAKTKYIECTSIIKLFVKTVFIIISGIPAPS